MERLKLKLVFWLMNSLNMKFISFKLDKSDGLEVRGNIDINEFELVLKMIKELENGNKSIN
jgi:hypothetical protein